MTGFERNGISVGERVCHLDYLHRRGRVVRCEPEGVTVRWDDGKDGELVWDAAVAYNAFRLQVVREAALQQPPATLHSTKDDNAKS